MSLIKFIQVLLHSVVLTSITGKNPSAISCCEKQVSRRRRNKTLFIHSEVVLPLLYKKTLGKETDQLLCNGTKLFFYYKTIRVNLKSSQQVRLVYRKCCRKVVSRLLPSCAKRCWSRVNKTTKNTPRSDFLHWCSWSNTED